MKGEVLKLVLIDDAGFLLPDHHLSLRQMELEGLVKTFKAGACWNIKVLNYLEAEGILFCDIVSYKLEGQQFPDRQLQLEDELLNVRAIRYRSIDTAGLLRTANLPPTKITTSILREDPPAPASSSPPVPPPPIVETPRPVKILTVPKREPPPPPVRKVMEERLDIPFKKVKFILGGASFEWQPPGMNKPLTITIPNNELREEFEAVKNYFANVLKAKSIQVIVKLEMENHRIISVSASSPQIDRIDKKMVESVKFEFVRNTTKKRIVTQVDKSLFTMQEYFDTFSNEKLKANAFYENEQQLFEDLLSISNTKHYQYLRYLSQQHAHHILKLRFVYKPFSFIFLVEGERQYHLIWETLDTTEATYVWHIEKNLEVLKASLRKIEDIINLVKVQGKTAYIQSSEDAYRRIFHDYSPLVDGFFKWKAELESYLT